MMLKLKLQYFGHLMRRVDSLEKTLMLGGIGGRRRRGRQRMRWLDGITNMMDIVRKHLTGGFLCAVLDLSGILCSLLIPEYSGIKRGKPLPGAEGSRHFLG